VSRGLKMYIVRAATATAGVTAPGFRGSLAVIVALCAEAVSGYLLLATAAANTRSRPGSGAEDSQVSF
jgi:hypothetical protein